MEIVKKREEFRSLSKVVAKTDLKEIYLLSCNVFRTVDALSFEQIGADINFSGNLLNEGDDGFTAQVDLTIAGHPKDDKDSAVIMIEAKYNLDYSLKDKEGLTDIDLNVFCEMNAVYNVWPYFREFVQNMAGRMDIPPLLLPLLKIRPPKIRKRAPSAAKKKKKT